MKYFILSIIVLGLISCGGEKKKLTYYDDSDTETSTDYADAMRDEYNKMSNTEIISVPFTEQGGVKFVKVVINGVGLDMIFDTGCSSTLISMSEAEYLYKKGKLTEEDFIGVTKSQIADGSIVEDMVVNLKEVIIDGKIICSDVRATVSSNINAPLLLGNEVLNRVAAYAIDNENKTINFKLK